MNSGDIFNLNADVVPVAHGQRESLCLIGCWFDPVLWNSKLSSDRFPFLKVGTQAFVQR